MLFGAKKFRQNIYGQRVTVQSDHKSLATIFKRPLHDNLLRLRRMLLELLEYNLNVTYKPGKEMFIADTLSRNFMKNKQSNV